MGIIDQQRKLRLSPMMAETTISGDSIGFRRSARSMKESLTRDDEVKKEFNL